MTLRQLKQTPHVPVMSKETRDLKRGDVIAFSNVTVVTEPLFIQGGKPTDLHFFVRDQSGDTFAKAWNRHLLVNVIA